MGQVNTMKGVSGMGRQANVRGAILLYTAILIAALMGFAALAIDSGFLQSVKGELHNAADSAVLSGASGLPKNIGGPPEARMRARTASVQNKADARNVTLPAADVAIGYWNWTTRAWSSFGPNGAVNAVQSTTSRTTGVNGRVDTFLGRILSPSFRAMDVNAKAIGVIEPPNLVVALDLRQETQESTGSCLDDPRQPCYFEPDPVCSSHPREICPCDNPSFTYEPGCPWCVTPQDVKNIAHDTLNAFLDPGPKGISIPFYEMGATASGYPVDPKALQVLTGDEISVRRAIDLAWDIEGIGVDNRWLSIGMKSAIDTVSNAQRGDKAVVLIYNFDMGGPYDAFQIDQQITLAKNNKIRFYVIGLGDGLNNPSNPTMVANKPLLWSIADRTGGKRYEKPNPSSMTRSEYQEIMKDIAEHLPSRLVE